MNFRLARDQVVLHEIAVNLWASQSKAKDFHAFFSSFESGGITKHLMTGPAGNIEFRFPSTSGKQSSLFPLGPVIKYLILYILVACLREIYLFGPKIDFSTKLKTI